MSSAVARTQARYRAGGTKASQSALADASPKSESASVSTGSSVIGRPATKPDDRADRGAEPGGAGADAPEQEAIRDERVAEADRDASLHAAPPAERLRRSPRSSAPTCTTWRSCGKPGFCHASGAK